MYLQYKDEFFLFSLAFIANTPPKILIKRPAAWEYGGR